MKRLCITLLLILLGISPGIANARTLLMVGGEGGYAHLEDEQIVTAFNGHFAGYNPRISVLFPGDGDDFGTSMAVGTQSLYDEIQKQRTENPDVLLTIGGVSQGAAAVEDVLRRLMADGPDAPAPDELDVFVYGGLGRDSFWWGKTVKGYTYQRPPVTPYTVYVVFAEYDAIADMPDNLFNVLAVVNAVMGGEQRHVAAAFDPASDLETIPLEYIWKETNSLGGETWTMVLPTTTLPILQPLLEQGWDPAFVSLLDRLLRPVIDSAYIRNFQPNATERPQFPDTSPTPPQTEPLNPEVNALTLSSGSTSSDQEPGQVESGPSIRAQKGLVTVAEEATNATNELPPAITKGSDEADEGLDNAPDPTMTGRPAGATNLTDGNKFEPGQAAITNPTDQDTDVVEDAKGEKPPQISPANDGPTNDAEDADPARAGNTGTDTGGDGSE